MKVDAAIIGAGPAGGMAAYTLADSGLKIVLLEKSALPREKPCGGGIPEPAARLLDFGLDRVVEGKVSHIRSLYDFKMEKTYRTQPLLMVDRRRFDYELVCRALEKARGDLVVRDRFPVESVAETDDSVQLTGPNGEKISAEMVIAADGATGKAARQVGLPHRPAEVLALAADLEVPWNFFDEIKATATFNLFCLPRGYGWIFPKNGYLNCGVGAFGIKKDLNGAFTDFIQNSFPQGGIKVGKKRIHPVPIFTGRRPIATRRVCLAGDAACLVDPVMGEGIRYALESGAKAAECVSAALCRNETHDSGMPANGQSKEGLLSYGAMINRGIGKELDLLYKFVLPIFLRHPGFFYRKFFYEGFSYWDICRGLAQKMERMS